LESPEKVQGIEELNDNIRIEFENYELQQEEMEEMEEKRRRRMRRSRGRKRGS
jgi:hypothetical protein